MPNSAVARPATNTVRRSSVIASLLVCGVSTTVGLLGWSLDLPRLLDYGFVALPAHPEDVAGLLLVCLAFTATLRPAPGWLIATLLLAATLIAALCVFDHPFVSTEGVHSGITPAILVLLVMSVALLRLRRLDLMRVAALTAALAASIAMLATSVTLDTAGVQATPGAVQPTTGLAVALPVAITALVLAAAILVEACDGALVALAQQERSGWRNLHYVLPFIFVTPALIVVVQGMILPLPPDLIQLMAVVPLETIILGSVIWWLVTGLVTERIATREFARALDGGPIVMVDRGGTIVHWSRGCEELYGWPAALAVGQNKHALLHAHTPEGMPPPAFGTHPKSGGVELIERHRDGHEVRVLEQARNVEGNAARTVLSMSDITARAAAERALGDSETRLLLAAQAHSIGVFEWDAHSNAIHWVGNTETLLGIPAGTIRDYASWATDVFPEDRVTIERRMAAAIWAKADRFSFTYRMRRPDGEVRVIEGSSRCFYDEAGRPERAIGVNIDVTDRVANETQLAAREAQLRSVLETVPDAMIVIDEKGVILTFSPAAERLFGYAARQVVGANVAMLMPDHHGAQHDGYLVRYLETGVKRVLDRTRFLTARRADGQEVPIELRVGEARYADVRVFTGFVRDISERLETEERLNALRSELSHAGRLNAMGELAAGLAHEINQPLTAIANYLAAARRGIAQRRDDASILLEQITAAGEQSLRAGEIIRRMRDFAARHETDSRVEPVEPTIREASALVLVGYDRLDVTISYDLAPEATYMLADRIQIQQILVNLLRNSLDALYTMPKDERRIRVATRALDAEWIEIAVSDSGPGIDEAVLSQLYMPFTSTKGEAGMGIGLSICRRIVEAHGGSLHAENLAVGGAAFRFTVPRVIIEPGGEQL
ncbi:PAS domain-containing sensor histidine kinase [Sphingomonas echinoides]|uniref:PAS domain-containing sensor histidine kinase n=1 Tax=Sphingomonas echinoides TaxID=59803 RepID=UPI0024134403|nr:PAS domain S-box protein [Sphingomonas echinoides]